MRRVVTIVLGLLVLAWILYTLQAVGRFGGAVVVDPDTTARIMGVRNGPDVYSVPGLTYHGYGGAALVIAELLVVLGGAILAFFGSGWRRATGLLVLIAWTALWLGGGLWMRRYGSDRPFDIVMMSAAMLVAIAWSALRLAPTAPRSEAAAG